MGANSRRLAPMTILYGPSQKGKHGAAIVTDTPQIDAWAQGKRDNWE